MIGNDSNCSRCGDPRIYRWLRPLNPSPQSLQPSTFPRPAAQAQDKKAEVMPFNFNSPREPALAPDAPPTTYWNMDDIRKAHSGLAEEAAKALKEAGQAARNPLVAVRFTYPRAISACSSSTGCVANKPVPSLTKVSSILGRCRAARRRLRFLCHHRRLGRNDCRRENRQSAESHGQRRDDSRRIPRPADYWRRKLQSESRRLAADSAGHAAPAKARPRRFQLLHHENQRRRVSLGARPLEPLLFLRTA